MTASSLADGLARETARTTFAGPVVLEAGAGTGKTAVLVARTLTWILGPGWDRHLSPSREETAATVLSRVLALTFTEKAAGEMATRVGHGLAALREGQDVVGLDRKRLGIQDAVLRQRAEALLIHMDRLTVTTIHAWCRRLLLAHPVEAGLHPRFEVDAERHHRRAAVDEVVAEWTSQAFGPDADDDAIRLATEGFGPTEIQDGLTALADLAPDPDILRSDLVGPEGVGAMIARVRGSMAALVATSAGFLRASGHMPKAKEAATWAADSLPQLDRVESLEELISLLTSEAARGAAGRLGVWAKGTLGQTEEKVCEDRAALARAAADVNRECRLARLMRPELLRPALRILRDLDSQVRERMRSRGVLGFGDLLERALALLDGSEEVRQQVREGLDQILVDEFQDTDSRQYRIVENLALDGPVDARPGLFLVGDPKQSIYGWRQADLGAYARFLAGLDVDPLQLTVNFRSVPPILDEVRRVMEPTMIHEPGVQPPFEPLTPCPDKSEATGFETGGRRPVEIWVSWMPEPKAGEPDRKSGHKTLSEAAREQEAAAIAEDIASLSRDHDVPWRRFGLLFRTKGSLDTYLRALRAARVPFLVEGDRSFYERREVIDVVCALRAILDPTDHIALLGLLRSTAVGVPDAALLPLWKVQLPGLLTELPHPDPEALARIDQAIGNAVADLPRNVPGLDEVAGWEGLLREGILSLARLRASFTEDPIDTFLELFRHLLPFAATESARYLGAHRLANLDRLFRKVEDALTAGEDGPDAVLRELRRAVDDVPPEREAAAGEGEVDAVRVMTIHMAKGLDFDHVYVPDLHHEPRSRPGRETRVARTRRDGQPAAIIMGMPTPSWTVVEEDEGRVTRAESVRLLYVALTRARERLVMLGRWPDPDGRRRDKDQESSLVELVSRRLGGAPVAAWRLDGDALDDETDELGVRWRRLPPPDPHSGHWAKTAAAALRPDAVAAEAARLADARGVAVARSGRFLVAAASTLSPGSWESESGLGETVAVDDEGSDGDTWTWVPLGAAPAPPSEREHAREIGTAVHRALESLDLAVDLGTALDQAAVALPAHLADLLPPAAVAAAAGEANAILRGLAGGRILQRLSEVRSLVLGREVPFLAPPPPEEEQPIAAVVGSVDLIFRDPSSGEVVVADYKTDRIPDGDASAEARRHRDQGRVYARAVRDALGLESLPRFELWLLRHDLILPVDLDGEGRPRVPLTAPAPS